MANRAAVALARVSARMAPIPEVGPTESYRERFRRQLKATNRLRNSQEGQAITALIGAKQTDPMLADVYSAQIAGPRRAWTRQLLPQAIRAGEVAAGTEPDEFLDAIYGPAYFRKIGIGFQRH